MQFIDAAVRKSAREHLPATSNESLFAEINMLVVDASSFDIVTVGVDHV